jgi:hypothetical protein
MVRHYHLKVKNFSTGNDLENPAAFPFGMGRRYGISGQNRGCGAKPTDFNFGTPKTKTATRLSPSIPQVIHILITILRTPPEMFTPSRSSRVLKINR